MGIGTSLYQKWGENMAVYVQMKGWTFLKWGVTVTVESGLIPTLRLTHVARISWQATSVEALTVLECVSAAFVECRATGVEVGPGCTARMKIRGNLGDWDSPVQG
jgi:hypothetical protein